MHELSICLALMEQIEGLVRAHGASGVEQIVLKIGPLAGIEPELLQSAFTVAAHGSRAEQAQLLIESEPVTVHCRHCQTTHTVTPHQLLCPQCGDWQTDLITGQNMILQRVILTATEYRANPSVENRDVS